MWYFSWILGTGLALAFGVLNAIWYEVMEDAPEQPREKRSSPQPEGATPRVAGRAPYLPGAGRSLASTASKRARKPNETSSILPLTKKVGVLRTPLSVRPCRCSGTRCR